MNLSRQEQRVFNYIKENGSITSFDAFRDLGVSRLSAVIFEIKRKKNKPIYSKTIKVQTRYGEDTNVKRYAFRKKDLD